MNRNGPQQGVRIMAFSTSSLDTILNAGSQIKYPKPKQDGQWDSSAPFVVPYQGESYDKAMSLPDAMKMLQSLIPANVSLKDYLKSKGSTKIGDIDRTGEPPDPKMMNDLYATVQIDGRVIAELYNGGMCVTGDWLPSDTPDDVRAKFSYKLSVDAIGPQLAQKRAEEIAAATGGEIVYAKTALSQNDWGAQPDWEIPGRTNKQAWEAILDGYFNQHTAGTLLEAQLFGQEGEAGAEMGNSAERVAA
jgi:hypothetical protein